MVVGEVAMEMVRIEAGIPRSGFELTNAILVQESGLEDQMISFHKGCYIGQEVISRIKSVGKLNRQLCRFRLAGKPDPTPDQPVALMAGDQACGWLTSLAVLPSPDTSILAMGYVQTSILNQSLPIHVSGADGSSIGGRSGWTGECLWNMKRIKLIHHAQTDARWNGRLVFLRLFARG